METEEAQKRTNRKLCAFYFINLAICLPAAIRFGVDWPLASLAGGTYLFFVSGIWAEKAVLAWLKKDKG